MTTNRSYSTDSEAIALRVRDLAFHYSAGDEAVNVFSDVGFDVRGGEFVALRGRSGGGKTTLINVIAGLLPAATGSVQVFGHEMVGASAVVRCDVRRTSIAVVFQEAGLLYGMSVLHNVMLALRLKGTNRTDAKRHAHDALSAVGLGDLAHRLPADLSTGQRQRVGVARALAGDPGESKLILADEPTASLDEESGRWVTDGLRLAADRGAAVVVATHDPLVLDVVDRSDRMELGSLLTDAALGMASAVTATTHVE